MSDKVYGGNRMMKLGQMRVIFFGTRKAMAAALRISANGCREWYVETGNAQEIEAAKGSSSTLLYKPLDSFENTWITNPHD